MRMVTSQTQWESQSGLTTSYYTRQRSRTKFTRKVYPAALLEFPENRSIDSDHLMTDRLFLKREISSRALSKLPSVDLFIGDCLWLGKTNYVLCLHKDFIHGSRYSFGIDNWTRTISLRIILVTIRTCICSTLPILCSWMDLCFARVM